MMPPVFYSAAHAFGWYIRARERRLAPAGLDPSRQLIDGSSDGFAKVNGVYVEVEALYARIVLCLGAFTDRQQAVLLWGYGDRTDLRDELRGIETRQARREFNPLARRATAWLREHGMLRED